MPYYAAFHQGIHSLLRQNDLRRKDPLLFGNYDPSVYTIDQVNSIKPERRLVTV